MHRKFQILEIRFRYGEIGLKGQDNEVFISIHNLHLNDFKLEKEQCTEPSKNEDFLENEEPDRRNIEYKKSTFFFFLITYSQAHLENGAFLKIFTMGQFYTIFYRENIFGISFKENNSATFFWPSFPRTRRDHKNLKICCVFLDMKKDKGLKHSLIDVIKL